MTGSVTFAPLQAQNSSGTDRRRFPRFQSSSTRTRPLRNCTNRCGFFPEVQRGFVPYIIIRSMLAGESPKLASAARMVDWIYIDDTIRALMLIGVQPNVDGQVFEVGSSDPPAGGPAP